MVRARRPRNLSLMLIGKRCLLRPYRMADAEPLAAIANDELVTRWMTRRFPYPYTLADATAWLARQNPAETFAVEVGGRLAGGVGIRSDDGECAGVAEFGYWLGRAFWGRGIATEAAGLAADYVFAAFRLRRLEAHVFGRNAASAHVLEKCGFIREATLRRRLVDRDGNVDDCYLYARLATDPAP